MLMDNLYVLGYNCKLNGNCSKVNRPHTGVGKHVGMMPNIKRLQEAELRRFNDYQVAEASSVLAAVKACQELWLNAFEQLRRVEATSRKLKSLRKSQSQS